jgi:hypothetical protein
LKVSDFLIASGPRKNVSKPIGTKLHAMLLDRAAATDDLLSPGAETNFLFDPLAPKFDKLKVMIWKNLLPAKYGLMKFEEAMLANKVERSMKHISPQVSHADAPRNMHAHCSRVGRGSMMG